jgi:hypothetical protein
VRTNSIVDLRYSSSDRNCARILVYSTIHSEQLGFLMFSEPIALNRSITGMWLYSTAVDGPSFIIPARLHKKGVL